MDSRLYPQGKLALKTKYVAGSATSAPALVFYSPVDGSEVYRIDVNVLGALVAPGLVKSVRKRVTVAQINAGYTLLPAVPGFKYRIDHFRAVAYGGAVSGLTTLDILGTQSATGVKLCTFAQANLTQSTLLRDGATGSTLLADGASYTPCDANTAVTVGKTGGSAATATGVDIILAYALEP